MKQVIWVTFAVISCQILLAQTAPLLDLTLPVTPLSSGYAGGFFRTNELPFRIRIVDIEDRIYTVADTFTYEVEIRNESKAPVILPWAADPNGLVESNGESALRGSLSLFIDTGIAKEQHFAGTTIYGNPEIPGTVLTLEPGASARIKALGSWIVPQVRMKDYLAKSKGRLRVRAIYRIQTGQVLASTPPSPPKPLTLTFRPGVPQ